MEFFLVLIAVLSHFLALEAQILGSLAVPKSPYCQPKLCPKGLKHVACEKSIASFSSSCSIQSLQLVNLTEHTERIVKLHNERRNRLANGKEPTLPRAARLVAMQWSSELADLAEFNAKMCKAQHDDCHNSKTFPNSGQNIIVFNLTHNVENELLEKLVPELLSLGAQTWWSEYENMTADSLKVYSCDVKEQKIYRHFAVMAVEGNSHVGCAAAQYLVQNLTQFKLTCNYARAPVCGQQVYSFRPVGCKTGRNRKHSALCSPEELFL